MATLRPDEPVQAPRSAVTVPEEFRLGPLAECWAETGHQHDLGSAWGNFHRARDAWARAEALTAEQERDLPSGAPWALVVPDWQRQSGRPHEDPAERLARLGFTTDDVARLRVAAQQHTTDWRTP